MEDPLVEEIHEVRERLLQECGGDLERLMDRLKAREEEGHQQPAGKNGINTVYDFLHKKEEVL